MGRTHDGAIQDRIGQIEPDLHRPLGPYHAVLDVRHFREQVPCRM